jgi:hypothetical protein
MLDLSGVIDMHRQLSYPMGDVLRLSSQMLAHLRGTDLHAAPLVIGEYWTDLADCNVEAKAHTVELNEELVSNSAANPVSLTSWLQGFAIILCFAGSILYGIAGYNSEQIARAVQTVAAALMIQLAILNEMLRRHDDQDHE